MESLSTTKFYMAVQGHNSKRVSGTQLTSTVKGNSHNTNGLVNGVTCKQFRNFDQEDIRRIHYWSQGAVDLFLDKAFKTWDEVDVNAKYITTKWLADIVEFWTLYEV
jgi:hypothetical protein